MAADTDRLAEIQAHASYLDERLAKPNPWPSDNESFWVAEGWKNGTRNALQKLDLQWLVTELRAARAELAIREEQVAGIDQRYGAVHEALALWRAGDIDADEAMQRIHDALGTPAIPGRAA